MGRRSEDIGLRSMIFALSIFAGATVVVGHEEHHSLRRRISVPCQFDTDCVENAYCLNRETCFCKDNHVLERNRTHIRCLRVARGMGDPCKENVQCQVTFGAEAECREGRCECSFGSRFVEERCYKTVGLGDYCQTSRNCYVEDSDSFCETGRCVCPLNYHPNSDRTRCVKNVYLQNKCTNDEECIVENSRCINDCVCDVSYVISSNKTVCLKTADLIGESCEEDSQCQAFLKNTNCQKGKCTCSRGFHRRFSVCFRNAGLNEACESHLQCITKTNFDSNTTAITNVDCINGACSCSADHTLTPDGSDCIGYADNGVTSWRYSPIALIIATFIVVS